MWQLESYILYVFMLSAAQGEVIFTVVSFLYEPHSELMLWCVLKLLAALNKMSRFQKQGQFLQYEHICTWTTLETFEFKARPQSRVSQTNKVKYCFKSSVCNLVLLCNISSSADKISAACNDMSALQKGSISTVTWYSSSLRRCHSHFIQTKALSGMMSEHRITLPAARSVHTYWSPALNWNDLVPSTTQH